MPTISELMERADKLLVEYEELIDKVAHLNPHTCRNCGKQWVDEWAWGKLCSECYNKMEDSVSRVKPHIDKGADYIDENGFNRTTGAYVKLRGSE